MRRHCQDHVPALFHLLTPTHVILQGKKAQTGLDKTILNRDHEELGNGIYMCDGVRYAYLPHPSAHGDKRFSWTGDPGWPGQRRAIERLVAESAG